MKILNNLRTGVKLIGAFVVMALISSLVAVIGFRNMNSINNSLATLFVDRTVPIGVLGSISTDIMQIRGNVYKVILIPEEEAKTRQDIETLILNINTSLTEYKSKILLDSEVQELAIFEPAWQEYQSALAETIALADKGDIDGALATITGTGRTANARKAVGNSIQTLLTINIDEADRLKKEADSTFNSSNRLLVIIAVVAFLLAIMTGIVISNSISKPLGFLFKQPNLF